MPLNPFIGQPRAQLETWLRDAQTDLALGKTITDAGAGDTNFRNEVACDPIERIEDLLYALFLIDPVTYPASKIARVTRTQVFVNPAPDPMTGNY